MQYSHITPIFSLELPEKLVGSDCCSYLSSMFYVIRRYFYATC